MKTTAFHPKGRKSLSTPLTAISLERADAGRRTVASKPTPTKNHKFLRG